MIKNLSLFDKFLLCSCNGVVLAMGASQRGKKGPAIQDIAGALNTVHYTYAPPEARISKIFLNCRE